MVKINQDPHLKGYKLQPTYRVSAIFESGDDLMEVVEALLVAGFQDEEIEAFSGKTGAEKLDFPADKHGFLARLKRSLEMIYADETDMLRKIDMTLRHEGMAIFVATGNNDERKRRVLEVVKRFDPSEVCYWGNLAVERLWVRPTNVSVPPHSVTPP